jgi:hypothetical protein
VCFVGTEKVVNVLTVLNARILVFCVYLIFFYSTHIIGIFIAGALVQCILSELIINQSLIYYVTNVLLCNLADTILLPYLACVHIKFNPWQACFLCIDCSGDGID